MFAEDSSRGSRRQLRFHSPAIQVILELDGEEMFPTRARAGSQNTHKIIHSPELGRNLAPASAAFIMHKVPRSAAKPLQKRTPAHTRAQAGAHT